METYDALVGIESTQGQESRRPVGEGLHESKTNLLWEITGPARAELGKPLAPLPAGKEVPLPLIRW